MATETAMGQRISRAKKTLNEARVDFELPVGSERTDRLDDVMAVIYLIFNEGYTATAGEDWMRPELTNEAIRLARMLAELMPDEPEVHGLQALLELLASRTSARVDAEGRPVLLDDREAASLTSNESEQPLLLSRAEQSQKAATKRRSHTAAFRRPRSGRDPQRVRAQAIAVGARPRRGG
jgi:predicted RNA polymerase sigma factor